MSIVVVWTKNGAVDYVSSADTNVAVIDFQNLEAGGPAPVLSDAHKALLNLHKPDVLTDVVRCTVHYRCENCNAGYRSISELDPVVDLEERVAAGEPMPVGECPACGAVVHPVTEDWWPIPSSALDRHGLTGRFNVSPAALPLVYKVGLERVLARIAATRINSDDNMPMPEFGLNAHFGFDPDKLAGDCCFVNITILR